MVIRRRLMLALGAAALSPSVSFAQPHMRSIGWLSRGDRTDRAESSYLDAFKNGLSELGYTEGKDYKIEGRYAQGDVHKLEAMASDLIAKKVDLIVALTTPAALAAQKATRKIPIVMDSGDSIGTGLVTSLSHPGGNVTGMTSLSAGLYVKRLDLMRQIVPAIRRAGFLYNPDNPIDRQGLRAFESTCDKLDLKSIRAPAHNQTEVTSAFQILSREKAQALIVASASMLPLRRSITEQAARTKLPAVYARGIYVETGGLISYGPDYPEQYRHFAVYADKIFKGAKPSELPIEQPTKFETIVNIKTAKALGITIPDAIMLRADKIIE